MNEETPTIDTHRYFGMFRPPWEPICDSFHDQINERPPGQPEFARITNCFGVDWTYESDEELRADYLAGHFDVPQYEAKAEQSDAIVDVNFDLRNEKTRVGWQESYRRPEIAIGECSLCGRDHLRCLQFTDNEGAGQERVCCH